MQHDIATTIWSFDIRHGAESAGHAAILLSAFALTIIILLIGAPDLRRDAMSSFVIRPFMLAFVGNLIAAFQFMVVESDITLSERTFALMIPPQFLIITSTLMMLFGINLAVLRYFRGRDVMMQVLWLFGVVGLYTVGVLHRGMSDLFHVHAGLGQIDMSVVGYVSLLVWGPGMLVIALGVLVHRMRLDVERLHNLNLWLCTVAMIVGVVVFGVTVLMESGETLHSRMLPFIVVAVALTQWLVLGSCFYLLQNINDLWDRFPVHSESDSHPHPPHPPI